jgi:hypothetical protein
MNIDCTCSATYAVGKLMRRYLLTPRGNMGSDTIPPMQLAHVRVYTSRVGGGEFAPSIELYAYELATKVNGLPQERMRPSL